MVGKCATRLAVLPTKKHTFHQGSCRTHLVNEAELFGIHWYIVATNAVFVFSENVYTTSLVLQGRPKCPYAIERTGCTGPRASRDTRSSFDVHEDAGLYPVRGRAGGVQGSITCLMARSGELDIQLTIPSLNAQTIFKLFHICFIAFLLNNIVWEMFL